MLCLSLIIVSDKLLLKPRDQVSAGVFSGIEMDLVNLASDLEHMQSKGFTCYVEVGPDLSNQSQQLFQVFDKSICALMEKAGTRPAAHSGPLQCDDYNRACWILMRLVRSRTSSLATLQPWDKGSPQFNLSQIKGKKQLDNPLKNGKGFVAFICL